MNNEPAFRMIEKGFAVRARLADEAEAPLGAACALMSVFLESAHGDSWEFLYAEWKRARGEDIERRLGEE